MPVHFLSASLRAYFGEIIATSQMLDCLEIWKTNSISLEFFSLLLPFDVFGLSIRASFHSTVVTSLHHQVLDKPVEIRVSSIRTSVRTASLLSLPLFDAITAKSTLALGALFGLREHFETDEACEVVVLISSYLSLSESSIL